MLRVLAFVCLSWVASSAAAQDRPLAEAISVAREGECLTRDGLLPHLRTWLERDAVDARLGVLVEEDGAGARFVVLHDGEPTAARRFDTLPASCPDRRAVLALAVALAIDAALLESLRPSTEAGPAEDATAPSPPSSPAARLELAAEAQLLIEVLPEVAAGWQVGPRLVIGEVFELAASAWLTSVSGAELTPGRVSSQLAGGRLDVCLRRSLGAVWLRGCGGAAAGVAIGEGRDVSNGREAMVPFVGLLARLGLGVPLTDWLALELSVDGWIALLRPRFDLIDPASGAALQSVSLPLGGGVAALGIVVRF
ncbi:MAG: hypothetical protein SangKO_037430 [Sandaracinaceae bacterium]|nr:hypothetical protein [Myxococcales bacterium]